MIPVLLRARQPHWDVWSIEHLIHECSILLGLALDNSTFCVYSSHLNSYLAFCEHHCLPVDPMPDTLSYYVTYMSHHIQPCSVEAYLSGIINNLEPHFPHVCQSRHSLLVKWTLQGTLHPLGRSILCKEPILWDDLQWVLLDLSHPLTHDDLSWIAQLHCGFYGLLHLGELVVPDEITSWDFTKISLRTSVSISLNDFSFLIQRDKTDSWYEGNRVVIQHSFVGSDPFPLFMRYLVLRDSRFPLHPYLWLQWNGKPPTQSWFVRKMQAFFLKNVCGHSMRTGGATSLAAAGVSPDCIHAIGWWCSDT